MAPTLLLCLGHPSPQVVVTVILAPAFLHFSKAHAMPVALWWMPLFISFTLLASWLGLCFFQLHSDAVYVCSVCAGRKRPAPFSRAHLSQIRLGGGVCGRGKCYTRCAPIIHVCRS